MVKENLHIAYNDIENIQINFCKYLLCVGEPTLSIAVMGEFGH